MDSNDVERMRLKKQHQKARRKEKKAAKERASEIAVHVSEALNRVRMIWPGLTCGTLKKLNAYGFGPLDELTYEDLEQLGCDLANCEKLETVHFSDDVFGEINVDQMMSYLFRGWARQSSIKEIMFARNQLSAAGIRSMVPFLQNASNLRILNLRDNIQSEGFNVLFRALRDSPIERLICDGCGIESIEIDIEHAPRHLKDLSLAWNSINADGCRELTKLLQGGDTTLDSLSLKYNEIDDGGAGILVSALQNNKSLKTLFLSGNAISERGNIPLLRLVNDVSSIEATMRSNQTLTGLYINENMEEIQECIGFACYFNSNRNYVNSNRKKVIETQLHSRRRSDLCRLQGIERSDTAFYGKFDPLHLPEILALIGQAHGLAELHVALKSSMTSLFSTVDRIGCLEQELAYHQSKVAGIQAEIASIKRAEGHRDNKRRRV